MEKHCHMFQNMHCYSKIRAPVRAMVKMEVMECVCHEISLLFCHLACVYKAENLILRAREKIFVINAVTRASVGKSDQCRSVAFTNSLRERITEGVFRCA